MTIIQFINTCIDPKSVTQLDLNDVCMRMYSDRTLFLVRHSAIQN